MKRSAEILEELKEISPLLAEMPAANPFSVPRGYFASLPGQIIDKVSVKADDEFSTLAGIPKTNPLTVPSGYFDGLASQILEKVAEKPVAKVVSMRSKIWKYAVAAMLAGIILIGAFFMLNTPADSSLYTASVKEYGTQEKFSKGLSTLSDEEIVSYLNKYGNVMDVNALTRDIDASELPAYEDYITDADALNSYLEKISF